MLSAYSPRVAESATGPTDYRFDVEPAFSHVSTTTIVLGSALGLAATTPPATPARDPENQIVKCEGFEANTGCPTVSETAPIDAYVVNKHSAWSTPLANTQYIAPVPSPSDADSQCGTCTSSETTFENEFDIPEDGVATADLTISVIADNGVKVYVNDEFVGTHNAFNSTATFSHTFDTNETGPNVLKLVLVNGCGASCIGFGGPLGLDYLATVTYEVVATDPTSKGQCKKGGWAHFGFRNQASASAS